MWANSWIQLRAMYRRVHQKTDWLSITLGGACYRNAIMWQLDFTEYLQQPVWKNWKHGQKKAHFDNWMSAALLIYGVPICKSIFFKEICVHQIFPNNDCWCLGTKNSIYSLEKRKCRISWVNPLLYQQFSGSSEGGGRFSIWVTSCWRWRGSWSFHWIQLFDGLGLVCMGNKKDCHEKIQTF